MGPAAPQELNVAPGFSPASVALWIPFNLAPTACRDYAPPAAEGYPRNQGTIEEPGVRCFRTRTSRLRTDRVFPYRRRQLFALLRRPYTKPYAKIRHLQATESNCESKRLQTAQWNRCEGKTTISKVETRTLKPAGMRHPKAFFGIEARPPSMMASALSRDT